MPLYFHLQKVKAGRTLNSKPTVWPRLKCLYKTTVYNTKVKRLEFLFN